MLHQKIKRKRKERGFSQDYIASKLDITSSAYGKIERGITRLDIERLKQIVEVLEIDVIDLLEDENIIITHNSDQATCHNGMAIQPSYHSADTEAQKQLMQHLEEGIAVVRNENSVLRKENDRLLGIIERLTGSDER